MIFLIFHVISLIGSIKMAGRANYCLLQTEFMRRSNSKPSQNEKHKVTLYANRDKLRSVWKQEFDNQYEFYLAALRAEQDVSYLIQEHNDLLKKLEHAESLNIELRKEIRVLGLELYMMYQRDAHNSNVIDNLHLVDHCAMETNLLKSEVQFMTNVIVQESCNQEHMKAMLSDQLPLLRSKIEEGAGIMCILK
ncbi:uncharacterized protein LOC118205525, partial [Stegodyphus dumicola]|uniref:uncharacterized protein LOC118205525 n=1 Tax=Stegodyphus dumicola TaxID=202533 RepID=UPI0015AF1AC9